jgi:nucleotide-binding universal stress UspA family protein
MIAPQDTPGARVLVALDGSSAAAAALPFARELAARLGAQVTALSSVTPETSETELRQTIGQQLQPGETLEVRMHPGEPQAAILAAAAQSDVALLVLTTHGRLIEPGRLLGSVAEAIVAGTTRPIVLVRPEAAATAAGARTLALQRLLLPIDGTPSTALALQPVTDLAHRLGIPIDLLYVAALTHARPAERGSISAPRYVDQPHHELPHWAREVTSRLCACIAACPPDVDVRMHLATGEIGAEIERFAAEHATDMIVLVRHSQLEPGRATVLRYILDHTPCPVLLVSGVALTPDTSWPEATAVAAVPER